jgi:hypothetical protein
MASLVAAMSRASTSAVRRAKAFFDPSGLFHVSDFPVSENKYHKPDESVDLDGVNVVKLLQSLLNLSLIGLDVDNEDKSVVLLNLLHGALSVERVDDDLVLIETRLVRNRLAWVFWGTGELEGFWSVEGGRLADLSDLVGVDLENSISIVYRLKHDFTYTLQCRLSSSIGLFASLAFGSGTY